MTAHSRRRVLLGTTTVAGFVLAGCLGSEETEESFEPLALDEGQRCFVCGMVIEEHFGPAGQLFYADDKPEDHDGPVWFDSLVELENYHREHAQLGWELRDAFVTDYSTTQYEIITQDDERYISSHVDEEYFADATNLSYVVDSSVNGAMGPDYIPFSVKDDAVEFVDEYGGVISAWDELGR